MPTARRSRPQGDPPVRDLRALPKGHLHLHLQLGMRPGTLAELAERYGVDSPPTRGFSDFAGF